LLTHIPRQTDKLSLAKT